MNEIEQRLKDTSDACVKTYSAWLANMKDNGAREALLDAVHELRKVAARLEIELAVSERRHNNSDPIPIPPHRAARRGGKPANGDDDAGNRADSSESSRKPSRGRKGSNDDAAGEAGAEENQGAAVVEEGGKSGCQLSLRRSGGDKGTEKES